MILDGDVLNYLSLKGTDATLITKDEISDFSFEIEYPGFLLKPILSIDHSDSTVTLTVPMENPKNMDPMPSAMNALNQACVFFKSYYNRKDDTVYTEAVSFITEDNMKNVLDAFFNEILDENSSYIENLYHVIYDALYIPDDEDSLEEKDDTSILEDLDELMRIIG